jgi:aspartate dehydrogenase
MGYGAIGKEVAKQLVGGAAGDNVLLVAVLVSTERERPAELPSHVLFTADPRAFFAVDFDLCAEGAGQPAVRAMASNCLRLGRDFLITSIGALTDDAFYLQLQNDARENGAQLQLASGAMPCCDWMQSASLAGNPVVKMRMAKPPRSWFGTPGNMSPLLNLQCNKLIAAAPFHSRGRIRSQLADSKHCRL